MSEFRIHHDVNELLSLLRVHGGDGAEVYIDLLQKNRTPYVTTTVSAHSAKVSARPHAALSLVKTARPRAGHRAHLPGSWVALAVPVMMSDNMASAFHGPSVCSAQCFC